jgi:hypothetical protein
MDVTKTVQELLLSKNKDNNIIASEILKTCPLLIDTTFFDSGYYSLRGSGDTYGNQLYFEHVSRGFGAGKDAYQFRGTNTNDISRKGWTIDSYGSGTNGLTFDGGGYGRIW